jgi:Glycosyl hydrolases family 31
VRDDELATRWVQLGVFSPILRLHSSSNPFLVKEPWLYPGEARAAMTEALRFRHRLVPYLHAMNHRAAAENRALVRPLYHVWADDRRAYRVPNQFAFGSELLVAPITAPRDPVTLRGAVRAWLPPGQWIDVFTETVYGGDRELELHRDGASIPALLRAGGILPLAAPDDLDATRNPERLEILVAPGADGAFTLVEDDGTGTTPADIPTARTPIAWRQADGELVIGPAEDPHGVLPAAREWRVRVLGTGVSETVAGPPGERLAVRAGADPRASTPERSDRLFAVLSAAQYAHEAKAAAWATLQSEQPVAAQLAELHASGLPRELLGALAELLTAR